MATRNTSKNDVIDDEEPASRPVPGSPEWRISTQQTELTQTEREESEETSLVDMLRSALQGSSSADKVRVKLYRRIKGSASMQWCRDYTAGEMETGDLEMIRDEWGPGDYELRVIGSRGLAGRYPVNIAAPFSVAPMVAQQSGAPSELAQILASMQETQNRMLQALTERPDPQNQMMQTLALMKAFKDAMGTDAPRNEAPNQMAQLKELLLLSREIKGAAKELAGDEDKPTEPIDPLSMLPQVLNLVGNAMQQNTPAAPAMLPPIQLPASIANQETSQPLTQPQPLPQSQPQPTEETPEQMMMRGNIETLCEMAENKEPPEKGGEYIADNIPDEMIVLMRNKYWFEVVARIFPIIKPYEEWLRKAKAHADALLAEEDSAEDGQVG